MKVKLKPCGDCPFRVNSLPGWLGTFESSKELFRAAVQEAPYSCHSVSEITDMRNMGELQCAGRLMFAIKAAKSFRDPDLEDARRLVRANMTEGALNQILGIQELLDHHCLKEKL